MHEGKEYWVSRSVAVLCYVYTNLMDGRGLCVLANKRGSGVNKTGLWNAPSGYLDYDETLEEAVCREVFEETGVKIEPNEVKFFKIESNPNRTLQNVLAIYDVYIDPVTYREKYGKDISEVTNKYSEQNEVDEVKWIPIFEVENYDWVSYEHKNRIPYTKLDAIMRK